MFKPNRFIHSDFFTRNRSQLITSLFKCTYFQCIYRLFSIHISTKMYLQWHRIASHITLLVVTYLFTCYLHRFVPTYICDRIMKSRRKKKMKIAQVWNPIWQATIGRHKVYQRSLYIVLKWVICFLWCRKKDNLHQNRSFLWQYFDARNDNMIIFVFEHTLSLCMAILQIDVVVIFVGCTLSVYVTYILSISVYIWYALHLFSVAFSSLHFHYILPYTHTM